MIQTMVTHFTRVLLVIAATMLFVMMLLTAFEVIFRYLFNWPIKGAIEMVEYLMAGFVSFSIVYTAHQRAHVTVDFIMERFSQRLQTVVNFITTTLVMLLVILITWQNYLYIKSFYASKMTSAVLLIPAYPFVTMVTLGFGVFSIILAIHCVGFAAESFKK